MAELAIATGDILRSVLDSTHGIWSDGLTRQAYERYYLAQLATAWASRHLSRLALVEGGDVLASAKLYAFDAVLGGRDIRVAGLGAVFTDPAHRGRGHAADLVERLVDRVVAEGAELALLFSEIGADYYARLGFQVVPLRPRVLRVIEPARRGAPAMLVRVGEPRDLADIAEMNGVRARPYRFHLRRDRDLVQYAIAKKRLLAGLGPSGLRDTLFFVAEEGASAAAYVVIVSQQEADQRVWTLEECGDRDPAGARVGAILQALVARDMAEARPRVAGWLPNGFCPPQVVLEDDPHPPAALMMVRPLTDRAAAALPLAADDVLFWHGDAF